MSDPNPPTARQSWTRAFVCGLVAGGLWTLTSVTLLVLVGSEFLASLKKFQSNSPNDAANIILLLLNLGAGLWAMWLYVAIRSRFGPGFKTATIAAVAWWLIVSMQSTKWVLLIGVPFTAIPMLVVSTLVAMVISVSAAAWLYEK